MDEQFFTPTMAKYQQQKQEARYSKSGGSSVSSGSGPNTRPVSLHEKSRLDTKVLSDKVH
jgi:hypothetical protein